VATRPSRGRRARFGLRAIIRGWPWYYETTEVFDGEILLRTVPNTIGYCNQAMENWVINPLAFEPARDDSEGISLFRADFVTRKYLARINRHPMGVRVGQVRVRDCMALNLTLKPTPDASQPAGHVVIPEMPFLPKSAATKVQKQHIRDLAQKLAQIASKNKIYVPTGLPRTVPRAR
jgi:hypothetical protein